MSESPQRLKPPSECVMFGTVEQVAEKLSDDVILSAAKNLVFGRYIENKSRFFSPAESAGLQNDNSPNFSAACETVPVRHSN